MTRKTQFTKNIKLSEKLMHFIVDHPEAVKKHPKDSSYVVFPPTDKTLKKANNQLVKHLLDEGKTVVKAEKTKSMKEPWKFETVTP